MNNYQLPCKVCANIQPDGSRLCMECNVKIPVYQNMGGAGYKTIQKHHGHVGNGGTECVAGEVCAKCYRVEFEGLYSKGTCPV
jgi:hypothetical protein